MLNTIELSWADKNITYLKTEFNLIIDGIQIPENNSIEVDFDKFVRRRYKEFITNK